MSDNNPILFSSDGWYDGLTGERIDVQRLGEENMAGVGPNKSWKDAHDDALRVVLAQALQIEGFEARYQQIITIVQRYLKDVIDDRDLVNRMNQMRVGDKSHEKYRREIDDLTAMLHEIEQLKI